MVGSGTSLTSPDPPFTSLDTTTFPVAFQGLLSELTTIRS